MQQHEGTESRRHCALPSSATALQFPSEALAVDRHGPRFRPTNAETLLPAKILPPFPRFVNRLQTSKRSLAIVAGIAGFVSLIIALFSSAVPRSLFFQVTLSSSRPGFAELFYDRGRGINADDSVALSVPGGGSESLYRFPLRPGKYYGFRFDPIDRAGCDVTIRDAQLVDGFGRLRRFAPSDFKVENDISKAEVTDAGLRLKIAETDNDPILKLKLAGPLTLRISAKRLWQLGARTFFLCFISLGAVGALCLLFVPRHWTVPALFLGVLVAFTFLLARARFFAPISFDEEGFLFTGWLVHKGYVPYRDFFEAKPPVIFFANALGVALFGLKGFLFRIIPTVVAIPSIFMIYVAMIKRRIAPWLAALLTAQIALWLLGSDFHDTGLNDSETYGLAFTLLGFSFTSLSDRFKATAGRVAMQLAGGICFGLAVLSKELFVFSVIPAWLLAARSPEEAKWEWRRLLFSALGGLIVGLSFITYLVTTSAFFRYLDLLQFYRNFADRYCIDVGRFPKVSGLAVIPPSWAMLHDQLYNVNHLAFVMCLGFALLVLLARRRAANGRWVDVSIAIIAVLLGMVAVSIGHCFWRHYFLMGMIGLVLFSVLGAEALSSYLVGKQQRTSVAVAIALLGLLVFVAREPARAAFTFNVASDSTPEIAPIVVETIEKHSKPGDYILVTETPLVYVVMNRKSSLPIAFFLDDILPYDPTLQIDSLREKLEARLPKVFYMGNKYYARQTTYRLLLFEPLLAEHDYVKVSEGLWYLPEER